MIHAVLNQFYMRNKKIDLNYGAKDMEKKVLIVTGGTIDDSLAKEYILEKSYEVIIAVDGGLEVLDHLNQIPQYIVGDFDTVSHTTIMKYKHIDNQGKGTPIVMEYDSAKDATDTEIALELALDLKPSLIHILGATGTRLDHTLANIYLLKIGLEHQTPIEIIDGVNRIYMINGTTTLKKNMIYGKYVSLIPFTDKVINVTLQGFLYPLKNRTLIPGESIGVSNEVIDEEATIEFDQGVLMVIESKDA